MLKSGRDNAQQKMQNVFKPIVGPLEELVSYKKNMKHEIKDEKVNIKKEEKMGMVGDGEEEDDEYHDIEGMRNSTFQDSSFDGTLDETVIAANNSVDDDDNVNDDGDNDDDGEISDDADDELTGDVNQLIHEYLELLRKNKKTSLDVSYGVRNLVDDKLMIGDSPIDFKPDHIYVGRQKYPKSIGLVELLFKKVPKTNYLTSNDLAYYEKMVMDTNAHRKNYKRNGAIRENTSYKFRKFISPIIGERRSGVHKGGNVSEYKVARKNVSYDYVHWDDPNELVDRLRLLIASQAAGNSSHSNEIISIIEELREAEIIY